MEIILHRRNSIQSLKKTPITYGVEVDIRSKGEELIFSVLGFDLVLNLVDSW